MFSHENCFASKRKLIRFLKTLPFLKIDEKPKKDIFDPLVFGSNNNSVYKYQHEKFLFFYFFLENVFDKKAFALNPIKATI